MTDPIVKFAVAPTLSLNVPDCSACIVPVESTGDGYECPTCGTAWDYDASEDTPGDLYESWSGEVLDIEVSEPDDAWKTTISANRERRGY